MWPNPQFPSDLVAFPEKALNGKLDFLCSATYTIFNLFSPSIPPKNIRKPEVRGIEVESWLKTV